MLYEQYQYWKMCNSHVKAVLGSLYARYILSTLQRNCDVRAEMTHRQRKKWCKMMFQDQLFLELIPKAEAKDSVSLRIATECLKKKWTGGCLILGRVIYIAKNKMPVFYSKVKSAR